MPRNARMRPVRHRHGRHVAGLGIVPLVVRWFEFSALNILLGHERLWLDAVGVARSAHDPSD